MRARELWLHALDLDTTGALIDLPLDMLDRLLPELAAEAGAVGVTLAPTDRSLRIGQGPQVRGTAASLTRWLAGGGSAGLSGELPEIFGRKDYG
jgi:maleylpyruvate isomerase